ncbi:uncharacterized protein [Rutidosis leptorrhynchoides]|uniref:uncharacterized protein n=1 Tax=Rutidosis leptorrhynchoides TaxID=125765 RepID=UPI003A98FC69
MMNLSENPSPDLTRKRKHKQDDVVSQTTTALSHDEIYKIIQPFTREQLLQIVTTAALRHSDVLNSVQSIADYDYSQRSLYISGLDAETTSENLRNFFTTYGELIDAFAVTDTVTGKGKGYGYITFKYTDGAIRALKEPNKTIGGKMTVTRLARHSNQNDNNGISKNNEGVDNTYRKVYVGNVWSNKISRQRLLDHFASYGEVEEGPIGTGKKQQTFSGFAFFIYKNEEGARACLLDPIKNIDGHLLHCRLAIPRKGKALLEAKAAATSAASASSLASAAVPSSSATALSAPEAAPSGLPPHFMKLNPGSVSGQFSYGTIGSGVAAPLAATAAQVRGSVDGVEPEVVNLKHQSSMDGSFVSQFGGRGPSGSSANGGNVGGLGLSGGLGGTFGYGGGVQGPPSGHSQDVVTSNSGSGFGLSSFGSISGGSRLSTNGGYAPSYSGGGYGGSRFSSLGGTLLGSTFGGRAELDTGFSDTAPRSYYGLSTGSLRMRSEDHQESAHYSLS